MNPALNGLVGILAFCLLGGLFAKFLKFQPLVGYIVFGFLFRILFPDQTLGVERIAEVGLILLLFSIGLELSLKKLSRVIKVAVFGGLTQILLVIGFSFLVLTLFKVPSITALILSLGFSLSSTAVVVKILIDKGELDTIHGEVMVGWLLLQDLAVIPMMILIYALGGGGENVLASVGISLGKAVLAVGVVIFLGRILVPKILHKVSLLNSRELLVLAAVIFALSTALFTSFLGISLALGAFLAGVVISESQENLAIFAETRPLRDLFVAVFFVSLGFLATPLAIWQNLPLIIALTVFVMLLKFVIISFISIGFGYHGKTAISSGVGLSEIGEFSFVLLSLAKGLNLISDTAATIGIATTLLSLVVFPLLYKNVLSYWRRIKKVTAKSDFLSKVFLGWDKNTLALKDQLKDHVIICGYGRVGSWVGKAMDSLAIPFVVVEYNRNIVDELKGKGVKVIYGDPSEQEVLEAADIVDAKALIVAIPDRTVQEMVVALSQTMAPNVKIISRVHADEDWEKMKFLKVDKIIQPEFEAAVAIVRSMLVSMGRSKEEIGERIKNLRLSRAQY